MITTLPPPKGSRHEDLPKALQESPAQKSPAQWAYERIIMYINKFEETLDNDHEVGMGFAGGDTGVIKIEGLGFFDPDIVTYYGTNGAGAKTQLIQHVSQLNVMLTASPKHVDQDEPQRIGFQLAKEVAGAICDALIDAQLSLNRGHLVGLWFLRAKAARSNSGTSRRIDLTFRARVQDI